MFLCAKKAQDAKQALLSLRRFYAHKTAAFFIFIRLCAFCAFCAKQATFFFLDVFYARLKLSFLFAHALFMHYKTP